MLRKLSNRAIACMLACAVVAVLATVFILGGGPLSATAGWLVVLLIVAALLLRAARSVSRSDSARMPPEGHKALLLVGQAARCSFISAGLNGNPLWKVVGAVPPDQMVATAEALSVRNVCVLSTDLDYPRRRQLLATASERGIVLWTTIRPEATEGEPIQLRRWRIEDVLLGESADPDDVGVDEFLAGKVVLVTGAGGSIGAELCRQIARHQPSLLVLVELSEFALYSVAQALEDEFPHVPLAAIMCDVKSEARVQQVMQRFKPGVVFHAAAYKHVPLMEGGNAWEAIRNNVLGTVILARSSIAHGVGKFVLISTDKAVNPTNVMGASKRLAEMVCQAMQQTTPLPKFEMVRFGNVLGSAGSVIPRFEEQIAKGGPVTVTHPDMVRYFMSIPEAARLVLQAGSMGLGGEIFVMDMGKPIRILDLAQDMIRLSDQGNSGVPIEFSGLRPGEKLFEELLLDGEQTRATPHPRLRVAKAREVPANWLPGLLEWISTEAEPDEQTLRRDLKKWVPEYATPIRPQLRAVGGGRSTL